MLVSLQRPWNETLRIILRLVESVLRSIHHRESKVHAQVDALFKCLAGVCKVKRGYHMAQRQISVESEPLNRFREAALSLPRLKTRSVTRTIRLDSDIEEDLLEHAGKERLSANVVVNQALRRYLRWEVPSERFGFMAVSTSTMSDLFNLMTEEEARERGRAEGYGKAAEFVTFFFKKLDFEATLKALEMLGPVYGRNFQFEHNFDGQNHTVILRHHRGPKTSAYYAEALKAVFSRLGMTAEATETDDQVALSVRMTSRFHGPYQQNE